MDDSNRQRRRLTAALFAGNALASTAFLGAVTVAALAAEELTGSARLAGAPNAVGTVGSALGSFLLTALSRRQGRRLAFVLGFAVAAAGAAIGASSLLTGSLAALMAGMFVLGFGRTVSQLSRFAAGDLWTAEKRASAIGFVVWAGTIGSVVGPLLIVPAGRLGTVWLGVELAGPFVVCGVGFALAALWYLLMLRPEPLTLVFSPLVPPRGTVTEAAGRKSVPYSLLAAVPDERTVDGWAPEPAQAMRKLIRLPTVQLSFLVLMASQFVMVLVMTMTPIHIRGHGHGLSLVSGVMMAHTLGMFAISPVTGYLVDRFGARRVIAAGSVVLGASAVLAATDSRAEPTLLVLSLLLLGVGWNFGFVAGSAVFQEGLELGDRLRLQGTADALTWASGGVGALASGLVMSASSFSGLSLFGAGLALAPLVALWREGRSAARARAGAPETVRIRHPDVDHLE